LRLHEVPTKYPLRRRVRKRTVSASRAVNEQPTRRRRFIAGAGFGRISPTALHTASPRFGGWNRRESSACGFSPRTPHTQTGAITLDQSYALHALID
jgi:hypothetical protein